MLSLDSRNRAGAVRLRITDFVRKVREVLDGYSLLIASILAALGVGEVVLRVKNSNMQNYGCEHLLHRHILDVGLLARHLANLDAGDHG